MIRNSRLLRYFSVAPPKNIRWRQYFNMVEMLIYIPEINKHLVYLTGE